MLADYITGLKDTHRVIDWSLSNLVWFSAEHFNNHDDWKKKYAQYVWTLPKLGKEVTTNK